jgi:pimeloyl-ACP methyl ester carboxylesterase
MLKTDNNPGGLPTSVFDGIRDGVLSDRSQFYKDLSMPFYGYNRPNAKISEGVRENFWLQGMQGSVKSEYDTVKAFSETDFTEDLKKIDIPTLVLHGDDDQIVPNRSIWPHDREACQERKAQSLPRLPARNVSDPCRRHQRRRAGVPENLIETPSRKLQPKRRIAS